MSLEESDSIEQSSQRGNSTNYCQSLSCFIVPEDFALRAVQVIEIWAFVGFSAEVTGASLGKKRTKSFGGFFCCFFLLFS